MKGAAEPLLLMLHPTKRERSLGALNGALLHVPLSVSHKKMY